MPANGAKAKPYLTSFFILSPPTRLSDERIVRSRCIRSRKDGNLSLIWRRRTFSTSRIAGGRYNRSFSDSRIDLRETLASDLRHFEKNRIISRRGNTQSRTRVIRVRRRSNSIASRVPFSSAENGKPIPYLRKRFFSSWYLLFFVLS